MSRWQNIGPILSTGDIYTLVNVPHTARESLIAGTKGGLFMSPDCGRTWNSLTGPYAMQPVMAVAVAPDFPKNRTIVCGGSPGYLFRSLDAGASWESSILDYTDISVRTLAVSPAFADDGFILAGTGADGLYRSRSRGQHWETANFGLYDLVVWSVSLSPAWQSDQTAFAIVGNGLFRTTNGARAWKAMRHDALDRLVPQVIGISPDFANDGALLLGTEDDGIWMSVDNGVTWQACAGTAGKTINCLLFSRQSSQADTVYAGTAEDGVLFSSDGGVTWKRLGALRAPVLTLAEAVVDGRQFIVAGDDNGILRRHVSA